jgi:hypothetical protein
MQSPLSGLRSRSATTPGEATAASHGSASGAKRRAPPGKLASSTPSSQRPARPLTRTGALAAVASASDIRERIAGMKTYLADLHVAYAAKVELRPSQRRDAQFVDLLVAVENARDPELNLSSHTVDYKRLSKGDDPSAAIDLACRLVAGMHKPDAWHAIVSMNGFEVALSAKHDPRRPMHVSLVVVSSAHEDSRDWKMVASTLVDHLNEALDEAGKPRQAKVLVNCLNTSIQKTNEGSAIFAIAAAREMPGDPGIGQLHEEALTQAAVEPRDFTVRERSGDKLLGPRFFKHMTLESSMDALLEARPDLQDEPINKQQQTLHERQGDLLVEHKPSSRFSFPFIYSGSYEKKRLNMYEQAIRHIETVAAPAIVAARVKEMGAYLHDLRRAYKGKAALPAPRDAEFLDLLIAVENAMDPQLRLSAHKIEVPKLAERNSAAIADLSGFLADGVRDGAGWQATLDFDGHHAALSARHNPENTAHVSIALLNGTGGTGSPLPREHWQNLSIVLDQRLQQILHDTGDTRASKLWVTHFGTPALAPESALSTLLAAIGMKDDPRVAQLHSEALVQVAKEPGTAALLYLKDDGDPLIEPAEDGDDLLIDQIEMYRAAIGHFERSLASKS